MQLQAGHEIDRYVVEEALGEGGMAVVYRVRHQTLGTRHALKVLTITSRDVRERLIQEGKVQATLQHPNIVAVTDVLDVDGAPGLLMEFIQGPALDHWLYHYQPSIEEALTLFRGIVAGVGHAHAKGLIHRDLKPANVMLQVTDRGIQPKVTDFGLAKITDGPDQRKTRTGTTMGTPAYMAPEQIRDASKVDRRADVYSLGCILYELVCGRTPHQDDDIIELFAKVAAGDYVPANQVRPDLPNEVSDAIDALLEVNRDHRASDCAAILEILGGSDKDAVTRPLRLADGSELPPPAPMPPAGKTMLEPGTPAATVAKQFVQRIVTPEPAAPNTLPLKPIANRSRLDSGLDLNAGPTRAIDVDSGSIRTRERPSFSAFAALGFAILAGVFLLVALLAVAFAVYQSVDWAEDPTVTLPIEPEPAPEPVEAPAPDPDPVPEPAPEPVVRPDPTPAPVAPTPAPVAPTPAPEPVAPVPEPAPAPAPEPVTTGTVVLEAAAGLDKILLSAESGVTYSPGAVPPGRYKVLLFSDRSQGGNAGSVTVEAGKTVTIFCVIPASQCRVR